MRMRIALVCERFSATAGGVGRAVRELALELVRRERDVSVVCHTLTGSVPEGAHLQKLSVPRFWQPLRIAAFSARASAAF